MPYERFVILLKSRSHYTHPIHHFILFHQKCFSPTLGGNTKNIPFRFPSNNPIPLYYLSNILYERSMWLCKRKNLGHVFLHLFPSSRERKFQGA
jgi:hypothetical protein